MLRSRLAVCNRLTDFEHVRTENMMAIRVEMIGVVFHKRRCLPSNNGDDLHGAEQRACFPVALGFEC